MKSTDLAKRWTIVRNIENNMKCYFYGTYEEFVKQDCEEDEKHLWKEVKFGDWTSQDLAELFSNDLEDANEHRWTWMPKMLLAQLIYNEVPERERFDIIMSLYMNWFTA